MDRAPGTPPDPYLSVVGFSKSFGALTALEDVTFSIRPSELLGLIGPNGAGKTTLFECLAGVLPPNKGAVLQAGRTMTPRERMAIVFYLPDAIAPWPAQTLRWALEFTLGFFGGRRDLRDEVVSGLALEPLLGSRIGALSKGQRKRALLAVGLLTPHPVLLADEPFDGLDLRQSRDVAGLLRSHVTRGRTLFLSIHQIADAGRICDRFVLLSGGRVRGEGTLAELAALTGARDLPSGRADLEEVFLALT